PHVRDSTGGNLKQETATTSKAGRASEYFFTPVQRQSLGGDMKRIAYLKTAYLLTVTLFVFASATIIAKTQDSPPAAPPHVIEVVAKAYEFTPNEIHVKAGERVQIKLSSADRAHGLTLSLYPEGAAEDGKPGLIFD